MPESRAAREDVTDVDFNVNFTVELGRRFSQQLCNLRLVRVPDHHGDPGKRRDFLRRPLRIASRNHNPAIRIIPMQFPHRLSHFLICGGRHRTGIKDEKVGVVPVSFEPVARQQRLQCRAVGLRGPAPEILNGESAH